MTLRAGCVDGGLLARLAAGGLARPRPADCTERGARLDDDANCILCPGTPNQRVGWTSCPHSAAFLLVEMGVLRVERKRRGGYALKRNGEALPLQLVFTVPSTKGDRMTFQSFDWDGGLQILPSASGPVAVRMARHAGEQKRQEDEPGQWESLTLSADDKKAIAAAIEQHVLKVPAGDQVTLSNWMLKHAERASRVIGNTVANYSHKRRRTDEMGGSWPQ